MSKQCLDISQMQHLKELGVDTSNGSAYWYRIVQYKCDGNMRVISDWKLTFSIDIAYCAGHTLESVRTFTLQDILDLLPVEIEKENRNYQLEVFRNPQRYFLSYYWLENLLISLNEIEFIDAAYEMLCWVIENGYLEVKQDEGI